MRKPKALGRRERQIMDVLYRLGRGTVGEVVTALPDQPNYSTVRAQLHVLEQKGHVRHEDDGQRYVYSPGVPREEARKSALRHVVETFFAGSTEQAVTALLGGEAAKLSAEELDRIAQRIEESRGEEKL